MLLPLVPGESDQSAIVTCNAILFLGFEAEAASAEQHSDGEAGEGQPARHGQQPQQATCDSDRHRAAWERPGQEGEGGAGERKFR